ncbi:MAG: PadR family transcriptional regulator, partial [Halanaeroarchaeum sp.]
DGGAEWIDLTGFERDVLAATALATDAKATAPNGQHVMSVLEALGYEEVQSGRLYPTLDDLDADGLLEKAHSTADGRANRYPLTDRGETLLRAYSTILDRSLEGTDRDSLDGEDPELLADGGRDVDPNEFTRFQMDILAVLSDGPQHGLGIKADLEERYSIEVNHGRLYPNLDEFVQKGLVAKSERDGRTNEYELTTRGSETIQALTRWYAEQVFGQEATYVATHAAADGGSEVTEP